MSALAIVTMAAAHDVVKPCGCRLFADAGQLVTCEQHAGCQRCKRGGWDGVILADSEEWRTPVCADCYLRALRWFLAKRGAQ